MDTLSYNLGHKPFAVHPDPSFLWLGENHQKVFQSLLSGILDSKGFLLLTGTAGSGKTTLLIALTQSLAEDVLCAVIVDPRVDRIDFYNAIARGFGIDRRFSSKVQFLIHFSHFLHKAADKNKKVLLVVDNCHRLRQEMVEDLRLLASIEKADKKLLNIFFAGQPEFSEILEKPKNRAVRQRLRCSASLPSLNVDETADYIRHRLKVAGTEEELFTTQAVQAVHRYSQGIPRQINIICDRAMISGSLQAKQIISNSVIEACIEKMDLPATSVDQERSINFFCKKLISRFTRVIASIWRFIGEKSAQGGWLKYGFVLLALVVAGIYFWFSVPPSSMRIQVEPVEIAKVPEMIAVPQVSPSPMVAEPEAEPNEIKEEKTVTRQSKIRIRPLVIEEKIGDQKPVNQGGTSRK